MTGLGQEAADRYLTAVERQSSQYQEILTSVGTEFSELVIGGGTPLYLTVQQLERMFHIVTCYFRFSENRSLVVETAPNQTTREKLELLKQAGVSRISMGIQSFSDKELSVLGRQHNAEKSAAGIRADKTYDFPCVNVDFIYGIPGQTAASLLESLKKPYSLSRRKYFCIRCM